MIIQRLKDILFIIGSMSSRIPLMIVLSLVSIGLELIGLSLIVPYAAAIQTPGTLEQFPAWQPIKSFFSFSTHTDAVIFLSIIVLIIFGVKIALNAVIQNLIIIFYYDLQANLRKRMAKAYIRAPYIFHTKKRSGEIINIMQNHISLFSKDFVGSLLKLSGEFMTISIVGIYLLLTYPIPSLIAILVVLTFILIYTLTIKPTLRRYGIETITANNDLIKSTTQGIKGIKEAKVFGNTKYFEDAIIDSSYRASFIDAKIEFLKALPRFILEYLIISVIVLTVIVNLLFYGEDSHTVSNLVVFTVASLRLLPAASQITTNLTRLNYAAPMIEELLHDIKSTGDGRIELGEQDIVALEKLEFSDLNFSYPNSKKLVLNNLNLSINKGEIIGIFGETGSGKTTLVNIILGLLDFQKGKILFNDNEVDVQDWQKFKVASYVPQTPIMIDDQVMANVAIGQPHDRIERDKVHLALKKAGLTSLIDSLPGGIETITGEDALYFSGGQKQRLAISRSFYFSRSLIVLDEVTSALDQNTERDVLDAIKKLKTDAAIIIISHSPQTEKICDRIYYLDDGNLSLKQK